MGKSQSIITARLSRRKASKPWHHFSDG